MIKEIFRTPHFKRDYKVLKKKHYEMHLLDEAIKTLIDQDAETLSSKYKDHALKGNKQGYRELHIAGNWLLIYKIENNVLRLVLVRTGSHDDLF